MNGPRRRQVERSAAAALEEFRRRSASDPAPDAPPLGWCSCERCERFASYGLIIHPWKIHTFIEPRHG